jgi:hypothetical protein
MNPLDISTRHFCKIHGDESFLGSRQSPSDSRISQHFMEDERSLPCSQKLSSGPHTVPDSVHTTHPIFLKKKNFGRSKDSIQVRSPVKYFVNSFFFLPTSLILKNKWRFMRSPSWLPVYSSVSTELCVYSQFFRLMRSPCCLSPLFFLCLLSATY